jgi:hypothetical protein
MRRVGRVLTKLVRPFVVFPALHAIGHTCAVAVVGNRGCGQARSKAGSPAGFGCFTVLGAWLRRRFNLSHSQFYGAEARASQIGSRVGWVDLYSIVKELVGTAGRNIPRAGPQNIIFPVAQERDQGVARGPGGPPYYGVQ